jgi:hypothetical protein
VHWKFSFIHSSSRLAGSAGQDLAEYRGRLNPRIEIDYRRRNKPNKRLFAEPEEFQPESVNEPEWVQRGEKLSARDLVRLDRVASRQCDQDRTEP